MTAIGLRTTGSAAPYGIIGSTSVWTGVRMVLELEPELTVTDTTAAESDSPNPAVSLADPNEVGSTGIARLAALTEQIPRDRRWYCSDFARRLSCAGTRWLLARASLLYGRRLRCASRNDPAGRRTGQAKHPIDRSGRGI